MGRNDGRYTLSAGGCTASVRHQVWAHITGSRAKRNEGLYVQLGERDRVHAFPDIQNDAQKCLRMMRGSHSLKDRATAASVSRGRSILDLHFADGHATQTVLLFQLVTVQHRRVAVREDDGSGPPVGREKTAGEIGIKPIRVCRPWSVL